MKTTESQNQEHIRASGLESENSQQEGKTMAPPAFQLKVAGDPNEESRPGSEKSSSSPANVAKMDNGGGNAIQAKMDTEAAPAQEQAAGAEHEQEGMPEKEHGDEHDPGVRMAQDIAAEAGLAELAMQPDQQQTAESDGHAQAAGQHEGQQSVQRKAAGGPVIQRWGWLKKLWGGVKSVAGSVWNGVKTVGKGIANVAGKVWGGIKTAAGYAWKGIKAVAGYAWNVIKSVAALGHAYIIKIWPRIWKLIEHLGSGGLDLVKWLWTGIKTTFTHPGQLGKWFVDGLIGGGAWVGRLVTKVLDIAGLAEWMDFLGQVIKVNTRSLNATEIAEARKVLGSAVPYWKVRVDEASLIAKIANWGGPGMGVTIGYTVNFSKGVSPAAGNSDMHWLIHELTHVAQCESRGLQYIPEALIAQHTDGYGYGGPAGLAGKHLVDFNREQQGDICADYYRDVLYGNPAETAYDVVIPEAKQGKF
jgi:hypothetical protein